MMSDLVERARKLALIDQMADEIERLTTEGETLRNVIAHIRRVYTPNGNLAKVCDEALAPASTRQSSEFVELP